eukprot:jgi/Hompol1/1010/HPOL_004493-RA
MAPSPAALVRRLRLLTARAWAHARSYGRAHPYGVAWTLNLLFFEFVLVRLYLYSCFWPHLAKPLPPVKKRKGHPVKIPWPPITAEVHVAVIADPQLTDAYSYNQNPGILLWLTEFFSDIYMRRNYWLMQRLLQPVYVIFAGDLMDGGREWTDDIFEAELKRLHLVFHKQRTTYLQLGVPGNHDIGFGDSVGSYVHQRFKSKFGQVNTAQEIANHTIILLDTVSLAADSQNTRAYREAKSFFDQLPTAKPHQRSQNILVSHIPLYRPEQSLCGPRRRSKPITNRRGYQYQNMLQPELSNMILTKLKPDLIISGDDHDDCKWHTVGTFSWLQGNPYPSFGVMSLRLNRAQPIKSDSPSLQMNICSLPPQLHIYIWYIVLLIITIGWATRHSAAQLAERVGANSNTALPRYSDSSRRQSSRQQQKQPGVLAYCSDLRFWRIWSSNMAMMLGPNILLAAVLLLIAFMPLPSL